MVRFTLASLLLCSVSVNAFDRYSGYTPTTLITDVAAIDLDQLEMNEQLSQRKLPNGLQVYENGGNSGSYAAMKLISLGSTGGRSYQAGAKVSGKAANGEKVEGHLMEDIEWDGTAVDFDIKVKYTVSSRQEDYVNCQVGGLFVFGEANRDGCFAPTGNLTIDHLSSFMYEYNDRDDNKNTRTLKSLSKNAVNSMKSPSGTYYPEYKLFVDYYGQYDYGDHWVTSAANRAPTTFKSGRGNSDFRTNTVRPGRAEAMKKGAAYLNIWMEVIRELNEAVAACEADFGTAEASIDEAVAFYAGSLSVEKEEPGILLYALAEVRSHQFRTAGHMGDKDFGDAYINVEIFREFKKIQGYVLREDKGELCEKAKESKERIVTLMKVPLVQGVLRYAYELEFEYPASDDVDDQERMQDEGATFAAAILPFVYACGSREAGVVHSHMTIGAPTKFYDVKNALERTYDCMGITCEEVGGVWDKKNKVYKANPCGISEEDKSPAQAFGTFVGISIGVLVAGWVVIRFRKGRKHSRKNSLPQMMHTGNIAAVSEIS